MRQLNLLRLFNIIGSLLWIEALFMLFPLAVAALYSEADTEAIFISLLVTAGGAAGMRTVKAASLRMGKREGILLTATVWIFFSLFGSLPFVLGSPKLDFSRAFFEAMSGFTTTGASAIPGACASPGHGILLWQALMQWLGGMGIIIFTLALVPALNNTGGLLMYNAEATGITHNKLSPRISQTARSLWGTYFALTMVMAALLWAGPLDIFDSICFALGTVSTGGFSPTGQSPAELGSPYVSVVALVFMFLGGINFAIIYKAITWRCFRGLKSDVFRLYLWVVALFGATFVAVACMSEPWSAEGWIVDPLFQVVSVVTSTGYCTAAFPYGTSLIGALTIMMMFTGPCAGSTGGGAKLDRILVLMRSLQEEMKRIVRPNAVETVRIDRKVIPQYLVRRTVSFLCIFVIITVVGGVVLTLFGLPLESAMLSSLSCICNTGFSPEIAGYSGNFSLMSDAALWVLSFLMLIGRLEIFTILLLFTRSFWK